MSDGHSGDSARSGGPRGCGCALAGLGLLFTVAALAVALFWGYRSWEVQSTWTATTGRVVALVPGGGDSTFAPVVEYVSSDGESRQFEHNVFSTSARVGDIVDVLYDPAAPDRAVVYSGAGFWMGPGIFGVLAAISLIVTSVVALTARRRLRTAAEQKAERIASRPRRPVEYRRVETRINADGSFDWQIVARAEDGTEYRGDWLKRDPQMELMAHGYAVVLEKRGHDWVVVPE